MKTLKTAALALMLMLFATVTKADPTPGNTIDKIVNAYLELKNALVGSDAKTAKVKAANLINILSTQPDQTLTPAQQKVVTKYRDKLVFDARHISESDAIEHQREHFANLSGNMYEVLKATKMNSNTLYEAYCPMKKAYWISEIKDIKNPYFGSEMLTCGKVTETLAPVK